MKAIVDCNSFYCSCERLFRPELKNKPVVVLSNNDGCVISRSDEAKEVGIDMGAPYFMVKSLLKEHNVKVFSSNYSLYGDLSMRVMDCLKSIAGKEKVEVYSVDEAFVDLDDVQHEKLDDTGKYIRQSVERWTGIPVSVGISQTKTLAKMANRIAKKNKSSTGCVSVLIDLEERKNAMMKCKVQNIWGIGRQNAARLSRFNIENAWQLSNVPLPWARANLGGVVGMRLINELNGIPSIMMDDELTEKKMVSTSRMFGRPVFTISDIKEAIATYISRAAEKLRRQNSAAAIVKIFVVAQGEVNSERFKHGPKKSSELMLPVATNSTNKLIEHAIPLVENVYEEGMVYKKAGVVLSGLVPENVIQSNIFNTASKANEHALMQMIDNVNFSMRDDVVKFAATGTRRFWKMKQEFRSPRYSTRWEELPEVS